LAASMLGVTAAVWTGGVVTIAIVGVTALAFPRLRRLDLQALSDRDLPR
jgi:hypothetical protein